MSHFTAGNYSCALSPPVVVAWEPGDSIFGQGEGKAVD